MIVHFISCRTLRGASLSGPMARSGWRLLSLVAILAIPATAHAAPGVSFSPGTLDFHNQLAGQPSGIRTLAITNSGSTPLSITGISLERRQPGRLHPQVRTAASFLWPPEPPGHWVFAFVPWHWTPAARASW